MILKAIFDLWYLLNFSILKEVFIFHVFEI
jgi:hypothetical protein